MTVDTVEELRAELRECLFAPEERRALEAELADLIRQRNEGVAAEEEGHMPFVSRRNSATPPLIR